MRFISGHLTIYSKTFAKLHNHKGLSYFFPPISVRVLSMWILNSTSTNNAERIFKILFLSKYWTILILMCTLNCHSAVNILSFLHFTPLKHSTLIWFIARPNFFQFAREMSVLQKAVRRKVQNNRQQISKQITPVSTF